MTGRNLTAAAGTAMGPHQAGRIGAQGAPEGGGRSGQWDRPRQRSDYGSRGGNYGDHAGEI